MAIYNAMLRLHLGNECVDGVRPGEVGSEPVLCTAGVGLAFFTVGFCTGTASSLCLSCNRRILVLDWKLVRKSHSGAVCESVAV